jgi:hypothetical protein
VSVHRHGGLLRQLIAAAMSNQVYAAPTGTLTPYVSSVTGTTPGGGLVVKSLRITDTPASDATPEFALVRDSTSGDVRLGQFVIMNRLELADLPPDDTGESRPLVREPIGGLIETGKAVLVDSLKLALTPAINNSNTTVLVRNTVTGAIEQRLVTTLPNSGQTSRSIFVAQPTSDGSNVTVLFPSSNITDSGLSYFPGTGSFQVETPGIFTISWTIIWQDVVGTGTRSTWLIRSDSGSDRYANVISTQGGSLLPGKLSASITFFLATATNFTIHAFQSSGGNLDITDTGVDFTQINVSRLSIV